MSNVLDKSFIHRSYPKLAYGSINLSKLKIYMTLKVNLKLLGNKIVKRMILLAKVSAFLKIKFVG